MKITGPNQVQSKSIRKTDKKSSADKSAFASALSDGKEEVTSGGAVGSSGPITAVDALLSIQEVPDAATGRSKGLARAEEMLDMLEQIRRGILLGAIPMQNLRGLADMARNRKDVISDPRLAEILSEIELRAEVELAKLGV